MKRPGVKRPGVNRPGVNLLAEVAAVLRRQHAPFAVIGAAALAVHGVSRGTRDLDVFTVDPGCLAPEFWQDLAGSGVEVSVRAGDADDPLAGVVRFTRPGAAPVDLVVGRSRWQERIAASAIEGRIEACVCPGGASPRPRPAQALRRRPPGRLGHRAAPHGAGCELAHRRGRAPA